MRPRLAYGDHLVALVAASEAAGVRLAHAEAGARDALAAGARRESALLSAQLDGSPLTEATAAAVDASPPPAAPLLRRGRPAAGWAAALKIKGMATQEVAAVEYANLLACFDAEAALADEIFSDPLETLAALHGHICHGLVDPDVVGRPRLTAQAVHDGAQGSVLYRAPDPGVIPALLDGLASWLRGPSAALATLVVAGVLHERILEWQPYEAANGRLARAAARVALRARGMDPDGCAVSELWFVADPTAYYGEVAATMHRRGELGPWLERWGEALVDGLERAVETLAPGSCGAPSARALDTAATLAAGATITIAEYAALVDVAHDHALRDLHALVRAGRLRRDPGSRGLRFRHATA
jgi:hypothetical protein